MKRYLVDQVKELYKRVENLETCQQNTLRSGHSKKDVKKKIKNILSWYLPADTARTACKQIMEVI